MDALFVERTFCGARSEVAAVLRGRKNRPASDAWLVVGLGNPGSQYQNTRHNAGREVVETLAHMKQARFKRHRSRVEYASVHLGVDERGAPSGPAYLVIPTAFMNVSGGQVATFAKAQGIPAQRVLVVHDELDLSAHDLRLKFGGGEGGHNGLKSLSSHLGGRDYPRLRVGVGRPPGTMDPAKYVLSPIPKREREEWQVTFSQAANVIEDVVQRGFTAAQQDLHASR